MKTENYEVSIVFIDPLHQTEYAMFNSKLKDFAKKVWRKFWYSNRRKLQGFQY